MACLVYLSYLNNSDGCVSEPVTAFPEESWPETALGQLVAIECPCGNLSLGMGHPMATRMCAGNFVAGAQWAPSVTDACDLSDMSQTLCQISVV